VKIIDRYLGVTIARSTLFVLLVLLALFTFFTFADELNKTSRGSYTALGALEYSIVTMPRMVYQLFPVSALLGVLLGLGGLANQSELTAMRSAGVSFRDILRSVMKFGLLLMVIAALLGELLAPKAERYAQATRSLAMYGENAFQADSGLWIRDGMKFINIQELKPDGRLGMVNIFELSKAHHITHVIKAEQAVFSGNEQWTLQNIQSLDIGEDRIEISQAASENWASLLSPELLNVVVVKPETMSAWVLLQYANYLTRNGIDARKYIQAFWVKIVSPLNTAIMVLLALPFILGPLRSVSAGHRILVGTIVGIGFHILGQIFSYVGLVYNLNPIFAATFPTVLFAGLAIYLLKKTH